MMKQLSRVKLSYLKGKSLFTQIKVHHESTKKKRNKKVEFIIPFIAES